jgi:hypothetical protein
VVKGIKDARVLDSFCRLFYTNFSSNGASGSLAGLQSIRFADLDPAYYHELYMDQFESKFWDPGLAAGSQQKCGAYYYYYWLSLFEMLQLVVPGRNLDWYRLDAAQYIHCMMLVPAQRHFLVKFYDYGVSLLGIQWLEIPGTHGCKLSSKLKVLQFHHPAVSRAMKPLVGSGDSDSSWTLLKVARLLDVDWLVAAISEVLILCNSGSCHTSAKTQLSAKLSGILDSKLCRGPGNWTMVQKGLDCEVLVYAQSNFSVVLFSEFSFSCILLQTSTTATRQCISGVMLSWSTSSIGQILLSGFMLILWSTRCCVQILVTSEGTRRYSMEQDYCSVFVAEIVEPVG